MGNVYVQIIFMASGTSDISYGLRFTFISSIGTFDTYFDRFPTEC